MKKYTLYILIPIALVGLLGLFSVRQVMAGDNGADIPTGLSNPSVVPIYTQSDSTQLLVPPTTQPVTPTTPTTNSASQSSSADLPGGLVPCTNTPTVNNGVVTYTSKCDFNAFLALVNTIVKFLLFDLALPITAIMFVYAGFMLVTSGGSTEHRGLAKKVFTNAVIGFIIAMACWLIVETILSILGYNGAWIGFPLIKMFGL